MESNYWACDCLSMMGLKLNGASKRSPAIKYVSACIAYGVNHIGDGHEYTCSSQSVTVGGLVPTDAGPSAEKVMISKLQSHFSYHYFQSPCGTQITSLKCATKSMEITRHLYQYKYTHSLVFKYQIDVIFTNIVKYKYTNNALRSEYISSC